jgi:hypothetical protein
VVLELNIIFIEEMLESAVDDTAEDFSEIVVDADSTVLIGAKCFSTFVVWGDQALVPNIVEDLRAEDNVEEFLRIAHLNLWSLYLIISHEKPTSCSVSLINTVSAEGGRDYQLWSDWVQQS